MALKNLGQFAPFDCEKFLHNKLLMVTNCTALNDFDTKKEIGSKVEVVITKDETEYKPNSSGEITNNLFEKLIVKLPKKGVSIPNMSYITLVNPSASIYGEFRNMLSLNADDVKIIGNATKKEG